jgi:hypothetical protein
MHLKLRLDVAIAETSGALIHLRFTGIKRNLTIGGIILQFFNLLLSRGFLSPSLCFLHFSSRKFLSFVEEITKLFLLERMKEFSMVLASPNSQFETRRSAQIF